MGGLVTRCMNNVSSTFIMIFSFVCCGQSDKLFSCSIKAIYSRKFTTKCNVISHLSLNVSTRFRTICFYGSGPPSSSHWLHQGTYFLMTCCQECKTVHNTVR